jgi:hypothetical protein
MVSTDPSFLPKFSVGKFLFYYRRCYFDLQKETTALQKVQLSKHETSKFLTFLGSFCHSESGINGIPIQIHKTSVADPGSGVFLTPGSGI